MTIFTYMSENPDQARERQIEISLLLIESVEPLNGAVRPQGAE